MEPITLNLKLKEMATTTKTKPVVKQGRKEETSNPVKNNNPLRNRRPSEEQIREKAQEIYNQRMVRGEYGTEQDDWQRAEEILMNGNS
jgi:hypothetical protein